jgi:glucoamylase
VRLFFHQDFHISGTDVGDSAYYEPQHRVVIHYKKQNWFLVGVAKADPLEWQPGADQWAVGSTESDGLEGTWADARDGVLSGNPVAQGNVDSTVALHLEIAPGSEATGWYWIAAGKGRDEVLRLDAKVRVLRPWTLQERTRRYWSLWISKEKENLDALPQEVSRLYRRSLLIARSQVDNGGAIIAANDFDITSFARDTYSYMWPRDGALVAAALIDAGYSEPARRFFRFCTDVLTKQGYFLHKYNPDGSLASSWHPWYRDGRAELPVQEDETALVLWALWRHLERFRDTEFFKSLYGSLIRPAGDWLVKYRESKTGLPMPSWDLWEERRGVFAWTLGATWAGLEAAARFAEAFGEDERALEYRRVSAELRELTERMLWMPEASCFARGVAQGRNGAWEQDRAMDASIVGLWYFGMFPADEPRIAATMRSLRERLWVKTAVGGMARYEGDAYHRRVEPSADIPGNPWFICTLWLAQWHIAVARSPEDLAPALEILEWAASRALPSGVLAEQVDPLNGDPLSVSPLTWSHATLVTTARDYVRRHAELSGRSRSPADLT